MKSEAISNLGDPHNFGQRVFPTQDWIEKPRPLSWEWLFLSGLSPLRRVLFERSREEKVVSPDVLFPSLEFEFNRRLHLDETGRVSVLRTSKEKICSLAYFENIGRAIGMMAWFGVSDLHSENVKFGNYNNCFCFCPIDIECVFQNYTLITKSGLLSHKHSFQIFGLTHILEIMRKTSSGFPVCALLVGYLDALRFLQRNKSFIENMFYMLKEWLRLPIRVLIRDTKDYYVFLKGLNSNHIFDPILQDYELEQLARGDIPYFFRFLDSDTLYYFSEMGNFQKIELPLKLNSTMERSFRLFPNLAPSEEVVDKLKKTGVLQLVRYFDAYRWGIGCRHKNISIQFQNNQIFVDDEIENLALSCERKNYDAW